MNNPRRLLATLQRTLFVNSICSSLIVIFCSLALGQATKPTDGGTPAGLQAGAPGGSFSLSGFDNVSLFNGALNFNLPLLRIGGRGAAGHTVTLPIERHWMIETYQDPDLNWYYYPIPDREEALPIGYSPGLMSARFGGIGAVACPTPTPPAECDDCSQVHYEDTITRLSFTQS